jgi:hypothetical protein
LFGTIYQDAYPDYVAFMFCHRVEDFVDAFSSGQYIVNNEDFFARLDLEASAELSFAGWHFFSKGRRKSHKARNFERQDNASGGGADDQFNPFAYEMIGDHLAQRNSRGGVFDDAEFFPVNRRMETRCKNEVSVKDRAGFDE